MHVCAVVCFYHSDNTQGQATVQLESPTLESLDKEILEIYLENPKYGGDIVSLEKMGCDISFVTFEDPAGT